MILPWNFENRHDNTRNLLSELVALVLSNYLKCALICSGGTVASQRKGNVLSSLLILPFLLSLPDFNEDFVEAVRTLAKEANCKLTICSKDDNKGDLWIQVFSLSLRNNRDVSKKGRSSPSSHKVQMTQANKSKSHITRLLCELLC